MQNTAGGMCLLILAGMMNASFSLPMKFIRSWAWENTWLLWSIFALLASAWCSGIRYHPVIRRHPTDRR